MANCIERHTYMAIRIERHTWQTALSDTHVANCIEWHTWQTALSDAHMWPTALSDTHTWQTVLCDTHTWQTVLCDTHTWKTVLCDTHMENCIVWHTHSYDKCAVNTVGDNLSQAHTHTVDYLDAVSLYLPDPSVVAFIQSKCRKAGATHDGEHCEPSGIESVTPLIHKPERNTGSSDGKCMIVHFMCYFLQTVHSPRTNTLHLVAYILYSLFIWFDWGTSDKVFSIRMTNIVHSQGLTLNLHIWKKWQFTFWPTVLL